MTLSTHLHKLAFKFNPQLSQAAPDIVQQQIIFLAVFILNAPWMFLAFIWQLTLTDWGLFREHWLLWLFVFANYVILSQRSSILLVELNDDQRLRINISLNSVLDWAMILIFGPTILWLNWASTLIVVVKEARDLASRQGQSPQFALATLVQSLGPSIISALVSIKVYTLLGGTFPFNSPEISGWMPAIMATLTTFLVTFILLTPTLILVNHLREIPHTIANLIPVWRSVFSFGFSSTPFALPIALTYSLGGVPLFVTIVLGLLLVNTLIYAITQSNLRGQLRTHDLATLEQLGHDIIAAPADASQLSPLVCTYVPRLFPSEHAEVQLFSEDGKTYVWQLFNCRHPHHLTIAQDKDWQQLQATSAPYLIQDNVPFPPAQTATAQAILVKITAPDAAEDTSQVWGGIYVRHLHSAKRAKDLLMTIQEFAAQIGSALYRSQIHVELLRQQKMVQELEFAGHIQSSFLPSKIPQLTGWEVTATLIPARQTSGDFYDFVMLPNGNLGLIVADVADKGTGAALYMALSRTLIRTYAMQYPDNPAQALQMANHRILTDAETDQFVTVFYGVLSPQTGTLRYVNAGHNPAYVVNGIVQSLAKTGMPLGIFDGMSWEVGEVQLQLGDVLVAYSDGIPEAQNKEAVEFGEQQFLDTIQKNQMQPALMIEQQITTAVQNFVADAPQFDDITLMIVRRNPEE